MYSKIQRKKHGSGVGTVFRISRDGNMTIFTCITNIIVTFSFNELTFSQINSPLPACLDMLSVLI